MTGASRFPASSPELALPPAQVEDLMQVVSKGIRATQLYLPNNPVYQRAVDNIRAAFRQIWQATDDLHFDVGETELRWEDAVVYSQDQRNESEPSCSHLTLCSASSTRSVPNMVSLYSPQRDSSETSGSYRRTRSVMSNVGISPPPPTLAGSSTLDAGSTVDALISTYAPSARNG